MAIGAINQHTQIQKPQFNAISPGSQAPQGAGQQGCKMSCCGGATNPCALPKSCGGGSCSPAGVGQGSGAGQANSTSDIMQLLISMLQNLGRGTPSAAKA